MTKPIRNPDGTPYILPLDLPREAPSLLLQTISSLLDPQYLPIVTPVSTGFQSTSIPNLALIALSITPHLSDAHTARMPSDMDLLPVSSRWINDFKTLFECLCSSVYSEGEATPFEDRSDRELSRQAVFKRGVEIWGVIRDWGAYRIPLADLIFDFWKKAGGDAGESSPCVWKMLGQEYALRVMERIAQERQDDTAAAQETEISSSQYEPEDILRHLITTASSCQYHLQPQRFEPDRPMQTPASAGPTSPPLAPAGSNVSSTLVSPAISRVHSQQQVTPPGPSTASTPSLKASLLPRASDTSTGGKYRHQSPRKPRMTDTRLCADICPGCLAAIALVNVFSTLSFSPDPATANAQKVFTAILDVLSTSPCTRTRLLTLQYVMRLRADRNHRIYLIGNIDAEVEPLARTLGFANENPETRPSGGRFSSQEAIGGRPVSGSVGASTSTSRSRPASRGGGRGLNTASSSRSRSRASEPVHPGIPSATSIPLPRRALWSIPEALNFWLPGREVEDDLIFIQPSPSILTYEPSTDRPSEEGVENEPRKESLTLLVSEYVAALTEILEHETEWDILAYVLSHLPLQLSNKHFFCGPLCRESILRLQQVVCTTLGHGTLGNTVLDLPFSLHIRDAQSVGYHILTVLISYSPIFDPHRRDLIVRVLFGGIMAGIAPTITCCISALTLCAFELETQVGRYLPQILEILERIMSNAAVAVHVLAFLSIVGSKPELYSNFTEDHFRQVFAIALKYLEAHNDPDANSDLPFALTQHVLFMTFNVIYTWFLAVNLEDRPQFVRYITRQVLLASGNVLTEPAEVCFDWLARYTYSSVDPKPAPSLLRESVIPDDEVTKEVFFLLGKSIVSIRAEGQKGWLEVTARRPSGMTRFLCHIQNHPLVPAGDPQPDLISLPAAALENRVPARMKMPRDRAPQAAEEASIPKDSIEGEQVTEEAEATARNDETSLENDARQNNEEPAERLGGVAVESEGEVEVEGKAEADDGVELEAGQDAPQAPSKPGSDPVSRMKCILRATHIDVAYRRSAGNPNRRRESGTRRRSPRFPHRLCVGGNRSISTS
jgi:tuberous sclerosis protein 2